MWQRDLDKIYIRVRSVEFARVNLPLIAVSMAVGCAVLVGEVYIVRDNSPLSVRFGDAR
jgi:hypothetical protein